MLIWIYQNQIGKRNLTDYSRVEVALKLKETIAKKAEARMKSGGNPVSDLSQGQNGKTRDVIADMAGVSAGNVSKVEYIQTHAPEAAKDALR